MARKLASIQLIESLTPIAAADELVLAQIMGWRVVVKRSFNMAPGDKVVYFEIDSLLPSDNPVFEFMAKCNYRVRTMKLRGVTSQGMVLPLGMLGLCKCYNVGDDVTEKLGVTKWVHPRELAHDRHMMAQMKTPEDKTAKEEKLLKQRCRNGAHGCLAFPVQYVDKTDEPRVQSNLHLMQAFQGKPYYATMKIDGTSGTFLISPDTDKFVACSRNLQRDDTPAPETPTVKNGVVMPSDDAYWDCARKYKLEEVLRRNKNLAIQGEIYGPKISGNRLNVNELLFAVFNVSDMHTKHVFGLEELQEFCKANELPMVPLVEEGDSFNYTLEELLEKSKGTYPNTQLPREGLVWRLKCMDSIEAGKYMVRPSFKVINDDYLVHWHL